jgi:hypothetical protein
MISRDVIVIFFCEWVWGGEGKWDRCLGTFDGILYLRVMEILGKSPENPIKNQSKIIKFHPI